MNVTFHLRFHLDRDLFYFCFRSVFCIQFVKLISILSKPSMIYGFFSSPIHSIHFESKHHTDLAGNSLASILQIFMKLNFFFAICHALCIEHWFTNFAMYYSHEVSFDTPMSKETGRPLYSGQSVASSEDYLWQIAASKINISWQMVGDFRQKW